MAAKTKLKLLSVLYCGVNESLSPLARPVESEFYSRQTNALMAAGGDFSRDLTTCAAGTSHDPVGGEVDPDLKTVYSSVLPICTICARATEQRLPLAAKVKMAEQLRRVFIKSAGLRQRQQHVLPSKPINWLVGWLYAKSNTLD